MAPAPPTISRARLVGLTALAVAAARLVLILSAPDWLTMVDEGTWKHASIARFIAEGRPLGDVLGPRALQAMAWHPFSYHQVAYVPWNLSYAAFAAVVGSGYLQLHGFMALSAVLCACSWVWLLDRFAGRSAAILGAVGFVLLPLPAAALSVRPYSGHVEAQAFAVLALALAARPLLCGLAAGVALSLSPLSAPLLVCGAGAALLAGARPRSWARLGVGLSLGASPYLLRALLAPADLWAVPVQEAMESVPGNLLLGRVGAELGQVLWPPFHLALHAESISLANSHQGLRGGDDLLGNLVVGLAGLGCLWAAKRAVDRGRKALGWTLFATPWAALALASLGPEFALRYLAGTYPVGVAAMAFVASTLPGRLPALAAVAALATWVVPGALDLAGVTQVSRWSAAATFDPGARQPVALDAFPPLELWPDTTVFLEHRRDAPCCRSSVGFDAPFRPVDSSSARAWQEHACSPVLAAAPGDHGPGVALAALALERARRWQAEGVAPDLMTTLPLRNAGWSLAVVSRWEPARLAVWLDGAGATPDERALLVDGAIEGAKAMGLDEGRWRQALSEGGVQQPAPG